MGRIEKTVFISYRRKSSLSTMQPNFSSPQKRIRPHTLSPREPHRGASRRDKPTRRSIITIMMGQPTNPSPVSSKGEKLKPSLHETLTWKPTHPSRRKGIVPRPSPRGRGANRHADQSSQSG